MWTYLDDNWGLGAKDLVQRVQWKSTSHDPRKLLLFDALNRSSVTLRVIGVVLHDDFNAVSYEFDMSSMDSLPVDAKHVFFLGPPDSSHVQLYGPELLELFRRALRNSRHLSQTADDDGQGAHFDDDEKGGRLEFHLPLFKQQVGCIAFVYYHHSIRSKIQIGQNFKKTTYTSY